MTRKEKLCKFETGDLVTLQDKFYSVAPLYSDERHGALDIESAWMERGQLAVITQVLRINSIRHTEVVKVAFGGVTGWSKAGHFKLIQRMIDT
jgi:hypothetical protein